MKRNDRRPLALERHHGRSASVAGVGVRGVESMEEEEMRTIHPEDIAAIAAIGAASGILEVMGNASSPVSDNPRDYVSLACKAKLALMRATFNIEALGCFPSIDWCDPDQLESLAREIRSLDQQESDAARDLCKYNGVEAGVDFPATM